jgi:hypothetical protein
METKTSKRKEIRIPRPDHPITISPAEVKVRLTMSLLLLWAPRHTGQSSILLIDISHSRKSEQFESATEAMFGSWVRSRRLCGVPLPYPRAGRGLAQGWCA